MPITKLNYNNNGPMLRPI